MSVFGNYNQLLLDVQSTIQNAQAGFAAVFKNASDTDFEIQNMPLCDVRMKRAVPALVTLQAEYYVESVVEIEIATFHMTSRDQAAIMRDTLVDAVQWLFRSNPRFGGYVDSTIIGSAEFETGESKAQGEFVAAAVLQLHVQYYTG